MATDLTATLKEVKARAAGWSAEQSVSVLERLARAHADARVDWDTGAGEYWATLERGKRVLALLWMRGPLLVVQGKALDEGLLGELASKVVIIATDDVEAPDYRCDPATLRAVFESAGPLREIDPERFSVHDLWWATI